MANGRYSRQILLPEIGERGQLRLLESSALIVGCGALGCHLADALTRAGVGRIGIIDRDIPELSNLQRQVLFDERDVDEGLPKAEAAVRKLREVNSSIVLDGFVEDLSSCNVEKLLSGYTLVLDGTDNFESRYLINDACVKQGLPWIYGGVVGSTGMTMNILPGEGACLRCLLPTPPPAGSLPTCESQGILGTAPALIASLQATEALKILCGAEPSRKLVSVDLQAQTFEQIEVAADDDCRTCKQRRFDFLEGRKNSWVTALCGRNAIQISPPGEITMSLEALSNSLASSGEVLFNGSVVRLCVGDYELLFFPDGRAIIKGTTEEAVARSLYARYLGT